MTSVRYSPGHWRLVVTDHGVIVMGGDLPAALLTRIWDQVTDGRGLAAVLEALTGAFGTSLAAIPPFAVALAENGSVRLAVRGPITITIDTAAGVETATGLGVTTWTEKVVEGPVRVVVTPGDASAAPAELPIRDGVVLAGTVEWALGAGVATAVSSPSTAVAADEVVVEVAPEPEASAAEAEAPAAAAAEDLQPVPAPDQGPAPDQAPAPAPVARGPWSQLAAVPPIPPAPAPEPPVDAPAIAELIDSVPTLTSADTWLPPEATSAPESAPAPPAEPAEATTGYDHLWGVTVVRSVEDAAVREDEEDAASAGSPEPSPVETPGDHDGETVTVAQARALRSSGDILDSAPPPLAPPRAPAPGRVVLSTGQEFTLDRTVVIGRRPRSTRVTGTDLPHLVAVDSPQQDISRSHLELRVEGDSILATDLHTTNGTILHRAGSEPMRLHPGEKTVVVDADLLDLGDGITVTLHLPAHSSGSGV